MLKLKLNFLSFLTILSLNSLTSEIYSQEVDIVPYLKSIESGNVGEAKDALEELKAKNPNDPSVMFLDGVLTENGQEAIVIYQNIVDKYPDSKYADAALYRIFSYYYALGLYDTAQEKLKQLSESYPQSPYLKIADQNIAVIENSEVEQNQTTEPPNKSASDEDYKFTIQAGAFTNLMNAENLVNDFENSGIFSQMGEKTVGGTIFHIVYAGKFVKYEDAESFLNVINSKFKLNGSIVSYPIK